jgi:hypothetical protein
MGSGGRMVGRSKIPRSGPCPEGLRCTVPFVGDPVSEVETVKVHLEVAVTEQI